ncbi:hypothetical protein MTR67_003710 [Solanum verrucosum]|uniref:Uncharacterized protein n=1 Tax=Solanum verrucosum TaxID=315347 RepID=A0AAF0PUU3_SOLVR|nr:hypothetical protein MTR67_003710 [Solanum verrucosum]
MKWNYIDKKPYDICHMIEEAILVAGIKYPHQFHKRKNRIIRMISNPSTFDEDDDTTTLEEEDDDTSTTLEEEDSVVRDEDKVTNAEEETQQSQKQITKPLKIRITYSKTVQVAPLENHNNSNAITQELKITPETHDLDGLKEGTQQQSHNTTTMGSTKRMSTKHVQVAPRVKLLSDFSFEKELDGHKQLNKQSQKKRIDSDTEKKTPTQHRMGSTARKQCTSGLTKTIAITRPIQSSAPMQKETQNINEIKKFESSKRKFEERLAEQKTAKRRIIMVDHHDMPKLPNDPPATRRCWNRNRKRF